MQILSLKSLNTGSIFDDFLDRMLVMIPST